MTVKEAQHLAEQILFLLSCNLDMALVPSFSPFALCSGFALELVVLFLGKTVATQSQSSLAFFASAACIRNASDNTY